MMMYSTPNTLNEITNERLKIVTSVSRWCVLESETLLTLRYIKVFIYIQRLTRSQKCSCSDCPKPDVYDPDCSIVHSRIKH